MPATKAAAAKKKVANKSNTEAKTTKAKTKVMSEKHYYFFGQGKAEGNSEMRDLLGGKGAGLAEMSKAGIPVPPGFTITTGVCHLFYENGLELPEAVGAEMADYLKKLEKATGKKFGDTTDPLLVSVRSGSKFSMPGMMDTVLNLGLNDETVKGLAEKSGNERFALDNYRRFLQMFGNVVLGIDKDLFESTITKKKKDRRIRQDSSLQINDLKDIVKKFKSIIKRKSGEPFPDDPLVQLQMSRDAVFRSWNNPRAITYRRLHDIPSSLGTAVNIQAMVFGNMGKSSGTGVGFTRNPSTGVKEFYGEFLINAQGEDVVAGVRTPQPIAELKREMPKPYKQLTDIADRLEKHYRDIQDFEFTIEEGELYMLQTRNGKRTAQAAIKAAVDMVHEKLITKEEALLRIDPMQLDHLLHPRIDPKAKYNVVATGLAASPGAVCGQVVFTAEDAVKVGVKQATILVRQETSPDDIEGMNIALGILTSRGGMTSHAAVVARGMGKTCVSGAEALRVNADKKIFHVGRTIVKEGDVITLNGSTGEVILGKVDTIEPEMSGEFAELMGWADDIRTLGVRANADIPRDAKLAVKYGAEGIGLCRTEHMFFREDRIPIMQQMILADSKEERQEALNKLLPMQKKDFKGLFDAMGGRPVTIRTLDPPLHEFLPKRHEIEEKLAALDNKDDDYEEDLEALEKTLRRLDELSEQNPMLGHRGCRVGIFYPEITEMQVRAMLEAATDLQKVKKPVDLEIMIPLVGHVNEFKHQKETVDRIGREITARKRSKSLTYKVGTMIEVPRAALTAGQIAEEAEFFSFGTNDLTQLTMGVSRDDSGRFLTYYVEHGILPKDPFVSIDIEGVGRLMELAKTEGQATRPDLKVGLCGEHGGDPVSIDYCHRIGLDYVSCSPYRVPVARLAAAQSCIRHGDNKKKTKKAATKAGKKK